MEVLPLHRIPLPVGEAHERHGMGTAPHICTFRIHTHGIQGRHPGILQIGHLCKYHTSRVQEYAVIGIIRYGFPRIRGYWQVQSGIAIALGDPQTLVQMVQVLHHLPRFGVRACIGTASASYAPVRVIGHPLHDRHGVASALRERRAHGLAYAASDTQVHQPGDVLANIHAASITYPLYGFGRRISE